MNAVDLRQPPNLGDPTTLAVVFATTAATAIRDLLGTIETLDSSALGRYLERRDFLELQDRCRASFRNAGIPPSLASDAAVLAVWCFRESLSMVAAGGFSTVADASARARAAAIDLGRAYASDFGSVERFDALVNLGRMLAAAPSN